MIRMSPVQIEAFNRDGYTLVGPLLSPLEVDELRAAHDELLARWASECGTSLDEYTRVVSQWTGLWKQHPAFAAHVRRPQLAAVACRLLGAAHVQLFHDHLISKPPVHSSTIPWHQDYPFWPLDRPRALSCWVALDDVTAESGAMHFMPGAHHDGEAPPVDFLRANKQWGPREGDARPVVVPAGWGVFHDCLSWHMSPPNTTSRRRRAIIAIFMDAECCWDPQHSGWHPMNDFVRVGRGERFNVDEFPVAGTQVSP